MTPEQQIVEKDARLGRSKARLALAFGLASLGWVILTVTLIMSIVIPVLAELLENVNAEGTKGAVADIGSAITVVFASAALALFPTFGLPFSIIGLFKARAARRQGTPCPWAFTFNLIACLLIGLALVLAFIIFVL